MYIHLCFWFLSLIFHLKKRAPLLSIRLQADCGAEYDDPEKSPIRRIKWRSSNEAFVIGW
jgi:hypothetical protein